MNEQTVHNVIDKYEKTGTVHYQPKSGRKRKLSDAQVRQAVRKAKKGKSAPQIAQELKSMWIPGLYNEDFEKQGYSTEKS